MADQKDIALSADVQSEEDRHLVSQTLALWDQLYNYRVNYHWQWEEIARLIWPECTNTFERGSYNYPGMKFTQFQLDSTGMLALNRFTGIVQHLLTPSDIEWHTLRTTDPYLNKRPRVAAYFEHLTNILFAHRYAQTANFAGQCAASYRNLGAYGTHALFVDELDDPIFKRQGIRYRAIPIGELYIYEDHQGNVAGVVRYFRMTALQCQRAFGFVPPELRGALEKNEQYPYEFLHHVGFRDDFKAFARGPKGMPWRSDYIAITGKWLMKTGGYPAFPYAVGRELPGPREVYGRSVAMQCLPSLKSANALRGMFYRTGARIANPVLLINDDGLIDTIDLEPGAINSGGVGPGGEELVKILPTGNMPITENMLAAEGAIIKDSFLVSLFDILAQDRVEMTATEVIQRTAEKGALLAPMISRQSEFLGPLIDRELQILHSLKKLPKMPPELVEAHGEYQVEYTSPLNTFMRAGQVAGTMRTIESMIPVVQATGDSSLFDIFALDRVFTDAADIQGAPASYMATEDERKQKAQQRMQQLQAQMQIQAAGGQAGMISAQAKMLKAQHDTGQDQQQQQGPAGPGQGAPPSQGGPPPQGQQGGPPGMPANMPPPGAGQAPPQYGPPPG